MVGGIIKNGVQAWGDNRRVQAEVKLARLEAAKIMALKREQVALELGRVQVQATGRMFKYFTFFMWFGPFMISAVIPAYGVMIFENLSQLPEWYTKSCTALMFAVWGIQVSRQYLDSMFTGVGRYMRKRQDVKLATSVVKSSVNSLTKDETRVVDKVLEKRKGLGYTPL